MVEIAVFSLSLLFHQIIHHCWKIYDKLLTLMYFFVLHPVVSRHYEKVPWMDGVLLLGMPGKTERKQNQ